MEALVQVNGAELFATLTVPPEPVRAGVVVLHGAEAGERSYFLYEHLAHLLGGSHVAVLRYDRRPSRDGEDVPLPVQASDALAAVRCLRDVVGPVPAGLWGYSQGAWAAPLAAVTAPDRVDFLVCVSCCGVSPAEQMRVGCSRQLRKHGFSDSEVEELTRTRLAVEQFLRTGQGSESAQTMLGTVAARPWFRHAYLPDRLPEPGSWPDMDFDPRPVLARLSCPVLAFYGESDEWMPIEESIAAWQAAKERGTLTDVTVVRLAGTDHLPTVGGAADPGAISTVYSDTLTEWVTTLHVLRTGQHEES